MVPDGEKDPQEVARAVLEAVRPRATVLVQGKVKGDFNQQVLGRGGQVWSVRSARQNLDELLGNQPDAAMVMTREASRGGLSNILRPFFLDLESISDPDARRLAITILSVAAVHYARIVSADPALRLKPELLKAELLRKLQLFEKFPDLFNVRNFGKNWGLNLIGRKVQEFLNAKLTAVAA